MFQQRFILRLPFLQTDLGKGKLFPVMFYIYGGLFMSGSADFYSADYFMDEDVVIVTINYRLAALGKLHA